MVRYLRDVRKRCLRMEEENKTDELYEQISAYVGRLVKERRLYPQANKDEMISIFYIRLRSAAQSFTEEGPATLRTYNSRVMDRSWRSVAYLSAYGHCRRQNAGLETAKSKALRTQVYLSSVHDAIFASGNTEVDTCDLLRKCMDVLPPVIQTGLRIQYIHGCTLEETAKALGMTVSTYIKKRREAFKRVRRACRRDITPAEQNNLAIG